MTRLVRNGLIAAWVAFSIAATVESSQPAEKKPAAQKTDGPPLFDGLGSFGRKITTESPRAQRYFNQGLSFLYAFNHDEAIRSFRHAAELDPNCAMAFWGIALANGPHINNPTVPPDRAQAAWDVLVRARRLATRARPVERALIDALSKRHANPQPDDRKPLDEAYAAAMRSVYEKHRDDADVGALFAESLMDLRPWDLWTEDAQPQPGTEEIVATLEAVLERTPDHPLANHLYIHAVEASSAPQKADAAADRLRELQPGLGHLVHMPSHIDVRRGRWLEASVANERAIAADEQYAARSTNQGFYRIYMAHNYHMLCYAEMMQGNGAKAMAPIRKMVASIPATWLRENAGIADGFVAMPFEVQMRFGRWDEILAEPEPADYLPLSRTLWRYARGVAFAAKGQLDEARAERRAFLEARMRVPEGATFGNNTAADLIAVADQVLEGEILFREGKVDEAIAALQSAVRNEDRLRYSEPPDWIQPTRHVLGATLLKAGRPTEAEAVYREDLERLPENGWSLFGLARSLERQNKPTEAAEILRRFEKAWQHADIKLTSSCLCLPDA